MATNRDTTGSQGTAERRRFGRFTTRLPIRTRRDDLTRHGSADRRTECRLRLCDFSLGGLRAESPVPLKVNEQLTLHLPATERHPPTRLTGRVIHCERDKDRYQVGIAFHESGPRAEASPYRRLPRLFSVAADYAGEVRAVQNGRKDT
jgi:hypothetical protein